VERSRRPECRREPGTQCSIKLDTIKYGTCTKRSSDAVMNTQRVIYTGCSMEAVSQSSPMVYTLSLQQEFFHTQGFLSHTGCRVCRVNVHTM
jgi:hypothetical protein